MAVWDDLFRDAANTDPMLQRAGFFSAIPQNMAGRQFDLASALYEPTLSRWIGQTGMQLRQGEQPQDWLDFLQNNFNFQRETLRQPGSNRGGSVGPLRFM